jgi:predicted dehydrogenase
MVADVFLVIGAGSIGQRHARNLATLGQKVDLIPYREFNADVVAQRTDVAGVIIATATPIRLSLIQLCASQDWPFYVEKPLGWTKGQIADIYTAAAPVADRSMVGFMMRYHPAVRALAQLDLSDIYSFAFEIGHDVRQWRQNWSFAQSYASDAAGGGVLLDLCHELDIAHCLFPAASVTSAASLDHPDFAGVDFATRISLAAPLGTVAMDYLSPVSLRKGQLRGTGQVIDLDLLAPAFTRDDGAGPQTTTFDFDRNDMFLEVMADFIALATGQAPSDNPLMPRLSTVRASCDLIAEAWQARQFTGQVDVAF